MSWKIKYTWYAEIILQYISLEPSCWSSFFLILSLHCVSAITSASMLELIVLKGCHLCLFKWAETEMEPESEKNGAVGDRDRKKSAAWKGGKQFHANKGWTIGELSLSPPSLSEPGQSFSTRINQGEGLIYLFIYLFCRLLNALWSIPKRLILFRKRFPISLMLFNNSLSFFVVWSECWKDYLNLAAYE